MGKLDSFGGNRNTLMQGREAISNLAEIDPHALIREKDLGQLNFSYLVETLESVEKVSIELKHINEDGLAPQLMLPMYGAAHELWQCVQRVATFNLGGGDKQAEWSNLITQTLDYSSNFLIAASPVLVVSRHVDQEVVSLRAALTSLLYTTKEDAAGAMNDLAAKSTHAESILRAMEDAAAREGVENYTHLFNTEADDADKLSRGWLIALIVLAAATLVFGGFLWWWTDRQIGTSNATLPAGVVVQLVLAKVVVLSILFSAIAWTGKVYRALRHNAVVNKHRANALKTFRVFVSASSADDQTKNAVLLKTTDAIFAPQATGYASNESDSPTSPQIIEIIKGIMPDKGKS